MSNELWGALAGGIGVVLQALIKELSAHFAHKRELELVDKDMEVMKLEMEIAPTSTGSTTGVGTGAPTFDRVLGDVDLPKWVSVIRVLMRPVFAATIMIGVLAGFLFLLTSGADLSTYQQTIYLNFASMLEFMLLLIGTFYFGSKIVKR